MSITDLPDTFKRCIAPKDKKMLGVAALTFEELLFREEIKSEKQFQNQIEQYLNLRGVWFTRSRMDVSTTQRKGILDFTCCVPTIHGGRFVAVEAKYGYGKPTKEQLEEADAIKAAGGVAWFVWNLDSVKLILDNLMGK